MMGRSHPPEVRERARALYLEQRMSVPQVAEAMGLRLGTVAEWCSRDKWRADKPRASTNPRNLGGGHGKEKRERALGLYLAGHTYEEISERIGVPVNSLNRWSREGRWHSKREAARAAAPKQDTRTPAQREAMARASAEIRSGFLALRPVAPPKPEEAERAIREWLARNKPTVCPPKFAAPVGDEVIRPSYRGGVRL